MEFWETLERRHSVRDFKPTPISRETLERIIGAAASAPSAMNEQPWLFYVCTGETRLELGERVAHATVHLAEYMDVLGPKRYEDAMHWYSSLGDAPVLIAVTSIKTDDPFLAMNRYLSVGTAIENLLLAATAEGLGACNVTFAHWVRDEVCELLEIPEDRELVAIMALGHTTGTPPAAPPHRPDIAVWLD